MLSDPAGERRRFADALLREASLELARLRRMHGASHKTWRRIARAQARLAFAAALLAGAPVAESATALPAFASPTTLTGLSDVGTDASPDFADIDGDGDLDAFIGEHFGRTIFFANTGTAITPVFAAPSTNPFGLADIGYYASPTLVDTDGDGDLDAWVGDRNGRTRFFENTGSLAAPAFAAQQTNPFGLVGVGFYASPAFADIDGDGDFDAFIGAGDGTTHFFANTGTVTAPAFAAPTINPFGLTDVGSRSYPALVDIDGDGDLDVFVGTGLGDLVFFENTGTAGSPAFAAPTTNPFGLVVVGYEANPAFADIDGDGDIDAFVGEYFGRTLFFESVEVEACTDGLDNDRDGLIDLGNDPGCANAGDTSELSNLQCDNGLDDDGDGKIDWRGDGSGDPECMGPRGDREAPAPPGPGCGLGPELLLIGPLLVARRRSERARDG